jgi:hypothetical protein
MIPVRTDEPLRTIAIYIGERGAANLQIGLNGGIWGFKDSILRGKERRAAYDSMTPGGLLVLGFASDAPGGPRRPSANWVGSTFKAVHVAVITGTHTGSSEDVWPDDIYPNRVTFDLEWSGTDTTLSDELTEAMRLSGVGPGAPVVVHPGTEIVGGVSRPRAVLPPNAPTDKIGTAVQRAEQTWLRDTALGGRTVAPCALCGDDFPKALLTAAHIKQRKACSEDERRDPNVVMLCCPTCDRLFEKGFVLVGATGAVSVKPATSSASGVVKHSTAIEGRTCSAFSDETAPYFAHRYEENSP